MKCEVQRVKQLITASLEHDQLRTYNPYDNLLSLKCCTCSKVTFISKMAKNIIIIGFSFTHYTLCLHLKIFLFYLILKTIECAAKEVQVETINVDCWLNYPTMERLFQMSCRRKPKNAADFPDRITFIITFALDACRFWIQRSDFVSLFFWCQLTNLHKNELIY